MLQARLFSYGDAQRYRLGVNFNHIPVNAPKCPFHSYHRDGAMRTDGNLGGTTSYFPNSTGEWPTTDASQNPPLALEGDAAHWDHRIDVDHFEQPGDLFRLLDTAAQDRLFQNTARQLAGLPHTIIERHIRHCTLADPAYAPFAPTPDIGLLTQNFPISGHLPWSTVASSPMSVRQNEFLTADKQR